MRPLNSHLLVEAWDRGSGQSPLGRALTMLALAFPERSGGESASLGIPARDLELLKLRRMTFGDSLRGFLPCGACGESLEFETSVSSLLNRLEPLQTGLPATWQIGRCVCSMRPANSYDLGEAAAMAEPGMARRTLLERCLSVRSVDETGDEPDPVVLEQMAVEKFETLHQGAEIVFKLRCPSCREDRKAELDIAQFLWAEVRAAALTLLRDVHELARAYGWAEEAILTMTGGRRRAYLEMGQS